jgi:hypothetical protein
MNANAIKNNFSNVEVLRLKGKTQNQVVPHIHPNPIQ